MAELWQSLAHRCRLATLDTPAILDRSKNKRTENHWLHVSTGPAGEVRATTRK